VYNTEGNALHISFKKTHTEPQRLLAHGLTNYSSRSLRHMQIADSVRNPKRSDQNTSGRMLHLFCNNKMCFKKYFDGNGVIKNVIF
jgi:hypothetical protein